MRLLGMFRPTNKIIRNAAHFYGHNYSFLGGRPFIFIVTGHKLFATKK